MPKVFHAITIAAVTSAGLLVLSASPSLACYVTATACSEAPTVGAVAPAPVAHRRASLYNVVPADQQRIRCGHQRRIAPRSEVLHCREQSSLSA